MSPQPDDPRCTDELDLALRALPRAAATAGFQSRVLEQAKSGAAQRSAARRRRLSWSAAACVALAALGYWRLDAVEARAARRAALLDEHRRLMGELEELRELAGQRSLIRLGGDGTTDLYLDLATVPAGVAAAAATAGRPASASTRSQG